ncbi:MAG TPA: MarR family transcriptional regulator [Vicinamibacterales bacterium]|nr:MarR family transcriptional regulator [Vicinamibacterales bacterium]
MQHMGVDEYVLDVLMPDLVGHDRSPGAFLVYLALWTGLYRSAERRIAVSLQQLAQRTGLSKSAVQAGVRVLKRRGLVAVTKDTPTSVPQYELRRHWLGRRSRALKGYGRG